MKRHKLDELINIDRFSQNSFIDATRLTQINIAEDICNIIHRQIHIISGLQNTQMQREYITDLYHAILDVLRSFNDERIEINGGNKYE